MPADVKRLSLRFERASGVQTRTWWRFERNRGDTHWTTRLVAGHIETAGTENLPSVKTWNGIQRRNEIRNVCARVGVERET